MTTPLPPLRKRRPQKVVSDENRAAEILEELQRAELDIRAATERRLFLALEASDIGLTTAKIGQAVGVSQGAVSKWVKAARERRVKNSQ